ncbi:MAG: thiamine-binding protein [Flavobacteriaceae bacterium]|nr:thiamine-binding protein [Flavobacteriaceae bacterium]MCY4217191.1 thiamine-binding protein [Flavobacteriaceae bacterium]
MSLRASVDLNLTPLQNNYSQSIKDFIIKLRNSDFKVIETPLSTQIYGPYDELMTFLTQEIKEVFESQKSVVLHLKIFNKDRSHYQADF